MLMDEDDMKMIVLMNIEEGLLVQLIWIFYVFFLFKNNICSTVLGKKMYGLKHSTTRFNTDTRHSDSSDEKAFNYSICIL